MNCHSFKKDMTILGTTFFAAYLTAYFAAFLQVFAGYFVDLP